MCIGPLSVDSVFTDADLKGIDCESNRVRTKYELKLLKTVFLFKVMAQGSNI